MPNAKDAIGIQPHKFLMLGTTGSGKTSQILTLPGKKFMYLFDPNAILSIRGHDVDYEEFYATDLTLDVKSLSAVAPGSTERKGDKIMGKKASEVYLAWEKDFAAKMESGFFNNYNVIGMDSCTTFLDLIMDRILTINGRPGQFPGQDDYGPQMVTFTNVVRTLAGMGKMIYFTGHIELEKDELSQTIYRVPVMTGKLKSKIPLLFSDIFSMECSNDGKGNVSYKIQTVQDRRTPTVRCSFKGLQPYEDVTIDWSKPVVGQGIGGILMREQK